MIKVDYDKKVLEIRPFSGEELWKAYHLIDKGDLASAETMRILKIDEGEKSRRKAFLKIMVENVEFEVSSETIRLRGRVLECPEDMEGVLGHYHTLTIGVGDRVMVEKQELSPIHRKILSRDVNTKKYIVVAVELGNATLAVVKDYGVVESLEVEQDIPGKNFPEEREAMAVRFFHEVSKTLRSIWIKEGRPKTILIGPSVTREALLKFMGEKYRDLQASVAGCFHSSGGTVSAVNEFLRSNEMKVVARELKIVDEITAIESFFKSLVEEKAVYGLEETWKAVEKGAVSQLIIHVKLASQSGSLRERMMEMIRLVEQYGGEVTIVSGRHESAEKFRRIGGIGGILRYKVY
ncbi:MAG: mRNA surveillance protein pelota [Candidatus Brockarchaeota archaeon]|nr:mRNA surveillance protein pelota [Candidatus Brockarchaeota archaeon]